MDHIFQNFQERATVFFACRKLQKPCLSIMQIGRDGRKGRAGERGRRLDGRVGRTGHWWMERLGRDDILAGRTVKRAGRSPSRCRDDDFPIDDFQVIVAQIFQQSPASLFDKFRCFLVKQWVVHHDLSQALDRHRHVLGTLLGVRKT